MIDRLIRARRFILILMCLIFVVPLVLYAYTGTLTRYWADDYCYNAVLNSDGFWKAQLSFYQSTSDRYSVIPLVGVSEIFGVLAIRLWPLVAILLGLASLAWFLWQISGYKLFLFSSLLEVLLLSEIILFFVFWQAPNLFQILYWRTGMLTYYMPLVVQLFLAGFIIRWTRKGLFTPWIGLGIIVLAFFAGGFSETTAALQSGALGLVLAVYCGLTIKKIKPHRVTLFFLLAVAGGTVLAMAALFYSPANASRMIHMPQSADFQTLVRLSLRFSADFIYDTFKTQPLPTLVSCCLFFVLSIQSWLKVDRFKDLNIPQAVAFLAMIIIGTFLLIVCIVAPSVYIQVAYPEARAMIAARAVLVMGLLAGSWYLAGIFLRIVNQAGWLIRVNTIALVFAVVLSFYPLRASRVIALDIPYYQKRAVEWDMRHQEILRQRQAGQQNINVRALDSIAGLMELTSQYDKWPNTCVAGMYRVRSITGTID